MDTGPAALTLGVVVLDLMPHRVVRAAYLGQQASMHLGSAVVQNTLRRFVLGPRPGLTLHARRVLYQRFADLLRQDLENVEAGLYPKRLLFGIPVREYAKAIPSLALDMPRVLRRMKTRDYKDLPHDVDLRSYPPYYRRTFHWQSDGYLSRHSARVYDIGVEFLFGGAADVMRRRAIPPLRRFADDQGDDLRILDVACGTARTLDQIAQALPKARLTGLDLSPFYLEWAAEHLPSEVDLVEGNAEAMPFEDESFDAVVSVYLFHELPRNARRKVYAEMMRVLRPGGRLVILDSLQRGEAGGMDYFMERFPEEMHEPFYADYVDDEIAEALREQGFEVDCGSELAWLTKIVTAYKPTG